MRTARLLLVTLVALAAAAATARAGLNPAPRVRRPDDSLVFGRFTGISHLRDDTNIGEATFLESRGVFKRNATSWADLGMTLDNSGQVLVGVFNPTDGHLFLGGTFQTVNGLDVNYVVEYDGASFRPLDQGLNDAVNTMAHNGTALFVGGAFTASASDEQDYIGGPSLQYIAMWMNGRWHSMPGGGLDDQVGVLALAPGGINKLYVAGGFSRAYGENDNVPHLVSAGAVATASATRAGNFNATNVLRNPDRLDGPGNVWAGPYGNSAFLAIDLQQTYTVSMVRIANSRFDGGTVRFFLYASTDGPQNSPSGSQVPAYHRDPYTQLWQLCDYVGNIGCPLTRDPTLPYTDFYLSSTVSARTIYIDVQEYYEPGPALSSVQVFSNEKYLNAINTEPGDSITTTGAWSIAGQTDISPGRYYSATLVSPAQTISFSFKPSVASLYYFYVYTGPCPTTCVSSMQVTIFVAGVQVASGTVNGLAENNGYDALEFYQQILQTNNTVKITLTPVGSVGDLFTISRGVLVTSDEYQNDLQTIAYYDLDTLNGPTPLPNAFSGIIRAIAPETSGETTKLTLVGTFSGTDSKGVDFNNIVQLDTAMQNLTAYPRGGVQQTVYTVCPLADGSGFVFGGDGSYTYDGEQFSNPAIYYTSNGTYGKMGLYAGGTVRAVACLESKVYVSHRYSSAASNSLEDWYDAGAYNQGSKVFDLETQQYSAGMDVYDEVTFNYIAVDPRNPEDAYFVGYVAGLAASTVANSLSRKNSDGSWAPFGRNLSFSADYYNGKGTTIYAVAYFQDTWFVGGEFYNERYPFNYLRSLAMRNGTQWSPVDQGVRGTVYGLLAHNNELWIVGDFDGTLDLLTDDNLEAFMGVAAWDGEKIYYPAKGQLSAFSDDRPIVYAIAQSGGNIFIGGYFEYAGEAHTRNVAAWDGSSWRELGVGMNRVVYALHAVENYIVAGGDFNYAGGKAANYVAKYDLNVGVWTPLGDGLSDTAIALASDGSLNTLFIASYSDSGDFDANYYFAKFDGTNILPLGNLTSDSSVYGIEVAPADNTSPNNWLPSGKVLVVYGNIQLNPGQIRKRDPWNAPKYGSAIFDGFNWIPDTVIVDTYYNDDVFLIGAFSTPQSGGLLPWQIAITVVLVVLGTAAIVGGLVYFFYYRNRAGK